MMTSPTSIPYVAAILFSLIMAWIYRRYLGSRKLSILLPYLVYVFIQETVLLNVSFFNSIVYNIYRPASVFVFAWIYFQVPFMRIFRRYILLACGIYLAGTILNYIFLESISSTSSYMNLARGFMIVAFGILVLGRYFYLDSKNEERFWSPLIWIAGSSIIFYSVISIAIAFQGFLSNPKQLIFEVTPYRLIPRLMSMFMYPCFGYAFYLCKKIK